MVVILTARTIHVQAALAEAVSGVYCGWASVGSSPKVYMTAMSIGWCAQAAAAKARYCCPRTRGLHALTPFMHARRNPYYQNEQKTAEPWLLHEFEHDFYGGRCRVPC
jgi:riboflavin kinase